MSVRNPEMKAPKVHNSLSWGKRKGQNVSTKDVGLISDAVASLNKFANDGSFMHEVVHQQNIDTGGPLGSSYANCEGDVMSKSVSLETNQPGEASKQALSANQLAAKALRLRMEGKHKEAEELLVRQSCPFGISFYSRFYIKFIIFLPPCVCVYTIM